MDHDAPYVPPALMSTAVREMPEDDRPRERAARLGPEALRDAELLAILFRTGTGGMGAVAMAERVISAFGDVRGLARASLEELTTVKGIGTVKAVEIKAALELGKRLAAHHVRGRYKIQCAKDIYEYLKYDFKEYETEHFKVMLLNTKNEVLKVITVSQGTVDATIATPREVFKAAVREGAPRIIVAHNHPSGDPEPSQADIVLTRSLAQAGEVLNICLLDHIVFGDSQFVSFKERQLL